MSVFIYFLKRIGEVEAPEAEYITCGVCDGVPAEEYDQGI